MPDRDWHGDLHAEHTKLHEIERQATQMALTKTENSVDERLDGLRTELERLKEQIAEARGAVATWRWIAGFLGVGALSTAFALVWSYFNSPH